MHVKSRQLARPPKNEQARLFDELACPVILIPGHVPLPYTVRKSFKTVISNQQCTRIEVREENSAQDGGLVPAGVAIVCRLPPGIPVGSPILVYCRLEEDGRLRLAIRVKTYLTKITATFDAGTGQAKSRTWEKASVARPGETPFDAALRLLAEDERTARAINRRHRKARTGSRSN